MSETSTTETINGVSVTEDQIQAWVAEAEAGYDVEALKARGRGRPGRATEASQVVTVRLTSDEIRELDRRADSKQLTRSEVIREALFA
ncbi:MAG: ribbon-helix-helix protein, CopG family [Actinomycetaceae bacterium]|nr:ribbon-helix-helix protein, CopG family [Actinomycetaceae bacterium]